MSPRLLLVAVALLLSGGVRGTEGLPEKAWQTLERGAGEKSLEVRVIAVSALGLVPQNSKAAAMAERALRDEKPEVRAAGARALGQMLSASSIPKLRKALSDHEHIVVMAAARSLVQLNDPDGYELYYSVLTGERKKGQSFISQELDVLDDPKKVAEFSLEEGIGFIPYGGYGLTAVEFIKKEEGDKDTAKAVAAKVLAADPDPQSREALVRAVSDKSWIVRVAALEAIAKRADPSLLDHIQGAVSDENDHVRYTAAAAVIRLTDVRSTK
jgi:HEAT repeat protein